VPAPQRQAWHGEYSGELWDWTLEAARAGAPDSRFVLIDHTRRAVAASLRSRFRREQLGGPAFCLGVSGAVLVLLGIASGGLPELRQLAAGLHYRDPQRVVILAQGPPFFGIRLGFRDFETEMLRTHSKTLESVAAYTWSKTVFHSERGPQEIVAAEVGARFFDVLGVGPALGEALGADSGAESFLASYDFWKSRLHGDRGALGRQYDIGGRSLRLAGVLPPQFHFLSAPISVWVVRTPDPPGPVPRWWLALRGVVGRLRPGVSPEEASKELRQVLVDAHMARRNFEVRATPVADLVYRPLWSYAFDLSLCLSALVMWAAFQMWREHRRGQPLSASKRYWGFFVIKTMLPLVALFIFMFEFAGVNELGITGGIRPGGSPLAVWVYYSAIALIAVWAWRDQPARCRVCLHRLREPLRIGVPGHVLLDTAGHEVMCPKGHGSVYTSESVLGSELSDRWMGFP
jgi:hypothetical protein